MSRIRLKERLFKGRVRASVMPEYGMVEVLVDETAVGVGLTFTIKFSEFKRDYVKLNGEAITDKDLKQGIMKSEVRKKKRGKKVYISSYPMGRITKRKIFKAETGGEGKNADSLDWNRFYMVDIPRAKVIEYNSNRVFDLGENDRGRLCIFEEDTDKEVREIEIEDVERYYAVVETEAGNEKRFAELMLNKGHVNLKFAYRDISNKERVDMGYVQARLEESGDIVYYFGRIEMFRLFFLDRFISSKELCAALNRNFKTEGVNYIIDPDSMRLVCLR